MKLSLLDSVGEGSAGVVEVPLELIDDNPFQERADYGDLTDLANDIRTQGVLSAVVARQVGDRYELAFGHRRKRACELANLATIPVIVRALTDEQMATVAYSENEKRLDVSIIDKARSVSFMVERWGWTQQQVADRLSISRPAVANMLRLLRLPDDLLWALERGQISARQAEALLAVHELPEEVKRLSENHWDDTSRPSAIVRDALAGASSDHIRERMRKVLERFTQRVDDRAWYREKFSNPVVESQCCDACPHAIRRDVGVFCPKAGCWRHKDLIMVQDRLSLAAAAAGVPVADRPRYDSSCHESFRFSSYPEILTAEPRCVNLRVVELTHYDIGREYPGVIASHSAAIVVCQKGDNHQCACEMKRKREAQEVAPTRSTATVVKAIVADGARVLAAALRASLIDPDLVRLLIGRVDETRDYETDRVYVARMQPESGDELIHYAAENALVAHVKEWRSPSANKAVVAQVLAVAGLPNPWEDEDS